MGAARLEGNSLLKRQVKITDPASPHYGDSGAVTAYKPATHQYAVQGVTVPGHGPLFTREQLTVLASKNTAAAQLEGAILQLKLVVVIDLSSPAYGHIGVVTTFRPGAHDYIVRFQSPQQPVPGDPSFKRSQFEVLPKTRYVRIGDVGERLVNRIVVVTNKEHWAYEYVGRVRLYDGRYHLSDINFDPDGVGLSPALNRDEFDVIHPLWALYYQRNRKP